MKKMRKLVAQYVHCPESRVIRFERHKTPYAGLYADGFSICGILCFQSKDGHRQSLVHANRFTQIETLIAEVNWIGEGGRCTVYTKNRKTRSPTTGDHFVIGVDFIPDLKGRSGCHFEVQVLDQDILALLLKFDGTVLLFKTLGHGHDIVYHPNIPQLDCVYKLNETFAYGKMLDLKQVKLLFDGENWQRLEEHDLKLHPVACQLLAMIDARPTDGSGAVLIKTQTFARKWIRLKGDSFHLYDVNLLVMATNTNAAIYLAPFIQQYVLNNNARCQFIVNVTEELNLQRAIIHQDHELYKLLKLALDAEDPTLKVSEVFEKCNYQSEYRTVLHGLIMGFNGFYVHYQRAQLGTWTVVDSPNQSVSHLGTEPK